MRRTVTTTWRLALLSALAMTLLGQSARAQTWADLYFRNRLPFTINNTSGRAFTASELAAATIPASLTGDLIRSDGSDIAVYYDQTPLPTKAMPMGGSIKVVFPLQAPLASGTSQSGYTLYFNGYTGFTPPASPAGVVSFDFRDGNLHGWKSLQDPANTGQAGSDVVIAADPQDGENSMLLQATLYHHPMAYADDMSLVGDATMYFAGRAYEGQKEVAPIQRFNTQVLMDSEGAQYITGADIPGVGIALDSYGSYAMGIMTTLGSDEGTPARRHPGPEIIIEGYPYTVNSPNVQFAAVATRLKSGTTWFAADWWQAQNRFGNSDPTAGGYRLSVNTASKIGVQPMPEGKLALMQYYTPVYVKWVCLVPGGWSDDVTTTTGTVESAPGLPPGAAVIRGVVYDSTGGPAFTIADATVTIKDAGNNTVATLTTDVNGKYEALVTATATPQTFTVSAVKGEATGSVQQDVTQSVEYQVDLGISYPNFVTGVISDPMGRPVAGAAVGYMLDGGPYVYTGANGVYTIPVPVGTAVLGAHKDGRLMAGPKWVNTVPGTVTQHLTSFAAGTNIISGMTPAPSPGGTGTGNLTDGMYSTFWESGSVASVSQETPIRVSFPLTDATITEVVVHWKNHPTAWHIELTNQVTNSSGRNPYDDTRKYYNAGENGPIERGGYTPPGETDRSVVAMKSARVTGVKLLSIVITGVADSNPVSIYEVEVRKPESSLEDAAAALMVASGLKRAPTDIDIQTRWASYRETKNIDVATAVRLARDTPLEYRALRVLAINYEPIIESEGNKKVRLVFGWNNPLTNNENHRKDMELASNGYLRIHMLPQFIMDEWPLHLDGTRYTDAQYLAETRAGNWTKVGGDYNAIIRQFDLVRRVDVGDVDEVWLQGIPGLGWWETTMAGKNSYWCNSGGVPGQNGNRLFILSGFNYERGNDCMLEDWGHRSESILGFKVYGGWNAASERTLFDKFTRFEKITPGKASCGNVHYPPNGTADYDFANTTYVSSDADDWLNYPNYPSEGAPRKMINRSAWATPHSGDYHRNYHIWWFKRFPHVAGVADDGRQHNWWKYVVFLNEQPESR